jgi:hypothetical protein
MNDNERSKFINIVQNIVRTELRNAGLMNGQWHLGTIDTVVSQSKVRVFVDGSSTSQQIPCNPDVEFKSGDKVFVLYINGDSKTKFVPFRRLIESDIELV